MFLPEIYLFMQRIHAAPFELDDAVPRERPAPATARPADLLLAAPPTPAVNEWDEWKSVRDIA